MASSLRRNHFDTCTNGDRKHTYINHQLMKYFTFLLLLFFLFSCKEKEEYKPQKSKGIPNALQERSVEVNRLKQKDTDLVEVLYNELLDKDPSLKQLENEINKLLENQQDSLKVFTLYNNNNKEYYAIYQKHLDDIKDSVLRRQVKKILDSSMRAYKKKFIEHQKVFDSTSDMYNALSDLHWILKLSKTLAVMEKYQDENLPDTASLKRTMLQLNGTIQKTDSMMKPTPEKQTSE